MNKAISSMAEIVRVGGWGLRGLGYPYGVSERAVPLLAWTEAAIGTGLRGIRLGEPQIVASFRAPKLESARIDGPTRQMQAHGRHLLEVGPPAMDLLTADVRMRGHSALILTDAIGSGFVPALANLLAHRKLAGLILFRAEKGDAQPSSDDELWLAFHEGFVLAPSVLKGQGSSISKWCEEFAPKRDEARALWSELDNNLGDARSLEPGSLLCLAWKPSSPIAPPAGENLVSRVGKAWRDGIETTAEDLRYLYQLETRAWAPTSERSRSQAGYGKF